MVSLHSEKLSLNVCFLVSYFYCITMENVSHHIFDIVTFTSFPYNRVRASKVVNNKLGWTGRLAQLLSAHAIGAGDLGSNPGSVKSVQCCQRLTIATTFLRSGVAQALSRADGSGDSLHASA